MFRVDGNFEVGLGHVMRCMSVADEAQRAGCQIVFIMSDGSLEDMVKSRGFECVILNSDFKNLNSELPKLKDVVFSARPSALLIDSYFASFDYLRELSGLLKVIYFDDLMREPYRVHMLINYNGYAEYGAYCSLYGECGIDLPDLVLGANYAPLRAEFRDRAPISISKVVSDVLVLVGGSDPERAALRIVDCLSRDRAITKKLLFHLVVGDLEPDIKRLREVAQESPWLEIHQGVRKMADLMERMDIAVSASGSTLYELCACGVPAINFCLADNQLQACRYFDVERAMLFAGDARSESFESSLMSKLYQLCNDYRLRVDLSNRARSLVDGNGSSRIVERIISFF